MLDGHRVSDDSCPIATGDPHTLQPRCQRLKIRLNPPPGIAQMGELAVDALPGIAQMGELAPTPILGVRLAHVALDGLPRAVSTAPPPSNPTAGPPDPPTRNLGIIVQWIAFQTCWKRFAVLEQPGMAGMQVIFCHDPVSPPCGLVWRILDRPVGVDNKPAAIINRLNASGLGPRQKHCGAAHARLHIIADGRPKALPDFLRNPPFPPGIGKRGTQRGEGLLMRLLVIC
jgi:hypothetical protein